MSLNGRLSSLRPRLAHATSPWQRPQTRSLKEFITRGKHASNLMAPQTVYSDD